MSNNKKLSERKQAQQLQRKEKRLKTTFSLLIIFIIYYYLTQTLAVTGFRNDKNHNKKLKTCSYTQVFDYRLLRLRNVVFIIE